MESDGLSNQPISINLKNMLMTYFVEIVRS